MKGIVSLLFFQALSSTVSGVLIANMSWLGKIGIGFFYKEYGILKVWWKTALLLFCIQIILIVLFSIIKRVVSIRMMQGIAVISVILVGLAGYATYIDFTTTSHKLMKTSFHAGFYLFWASMAITCVYFMIIGKRLPLHDEPENRQEIEEVN